MTQVSVTDVEWKAYYPGVLGEIIKLHATYYHQYWGFDISFETQEGKELCEFMSRFNTESDGLWTAVVRGRFAGAIAIDGYFSRTEGARLRWFIVEPDLQGLGIGRELIRKAVAFSRSAGHKKTYLWTFEGLDAARILYERQGFRLAELREVNQWGGIIREQKFELVFD
jgi:GNAT superfamily N-acetyltransferase